MFSSEPAVNAIANIANVQYADETDLQVVKLKYKTDLEFKIKLYTKGLHTNKHLKDYT